MIIFPFDIKKYIEIGGGSCHSQNYIFCKFILIFNIVVECAP